MRGRGSFWLKSESIEGSYMKYFETVINSHLLDGLKREDVILAFDSLDINSRKYRKDELIFCEEELIESICIPKGGRIKAEKINPNGSVHIIDIIEDGVPFGYEIASSKSKRSFCDFVALSDCELVQISMKSILSSKYVADIMRNVCVMIADESIKKINKTFILSENTLRKRLYAYFSILQKKSGTNKVKITMNREQMSEYLCVNRSALSNEISKMKSEGLIEMSKSECTLLYLNKSGE